MLNNSQRYILHLIRSSMGINDRFMCELSADETAKVENIIVRNGILLTVYNHLSDSMKDALKSKYYAALGQAVLHDHEGEAVLRGLSDAGIDCLALKGWELRKLYPNITMRQMADLDIFVSPYEYTELRKIMKKLGYNCRERFTKKHDVFSKGNVKVEMHKRLTDFSGSIENWERRMWSRTVSANGHIRRMTDEDFYIFHFIHLYKDFRNGLLGLRRIIDTWLLRKQKMDKRLIKNELEKLGILSFHNRMIRLCRVCMGEEQIDKNSEIMLKHAFAFGIFGSERSIKAGCITAVSKNNVNNGKFMITVMALFPPYGRMSRLFPRLKDRPALLPVYWVIRIVKLMRNNRRNYIHRLDFSGVSEKDIKHMKAFFKAGGIVN